MALATRSEVPTIQRDLCFLQTMVSQGGSGPTAAWHPKPFIKTVSKGPRGPYGLCEIKGDFMLTSYLPSVKLLPVARPARVWGIREVQGKRG